MNRTRTIPGSRAFIYLTGAIGLVRASEQLMVEAEAPRDEIDPATRFEPADISAKWVWVAGIGLLLTIWAIVVVLYPLFTYFKYERTGGKDPAKVLVWAPKQPPEPRNVSDPFYKMDAFRARETYMLSNYLWVDKSKGIVAIPIQRAIELIAQRGVPPSKPGGNEYYPPSAGSMRTGMEDKVEPQPR